MLYHLATTNDDSIFKKCYNDIQRAFYDEERYRGQIGDLPQWSTQELPEDEEKIRQVNTAIDSIVSRVCSETGLYILWDSNGSRAEAKLFPFLDRYHRYFVKNRRWNTPLRDPQEHADELFRLHKLTDDNNGNMGRGNYSANSSIYNHFVNVVAAMARLTKLFQDPEALKFYIALNDDEAKMIAYWPEVFGGNDLRVFSLMLTAFFHDIGKTIVYHRHGMEGATIISEHTSLSWYQLKQIAKGYEFQENFDRDHLLFIADMIDYHDQFGTLSTGEAGYQRLIDILQKIKRFSLRHKEKKSQIEWSQRYLFDLWLLNIADIIVSVKGKPLKQDFWLTGEEAERCIDTFFTTGENARYLIHDLNIAMNMLEIINNHRHNDFYSDLVRKAKIVSDRHSVERIRRLICASLRSVTKKEKGKLHHVSPLLGYLTSEDCLSESLLNGIIVRSIQSIRDFEEFCERFSWIGQMDYCLGFFEKILSRAMNRINYELEEVDDGSVPPHCFRSKWIQDKNSDSFGEDPVSHTEQERLQTKLIVENYTMTVVMMLDQLLFREDKITRMKNIEFNETRDRLTDEKIDRILSFNGIFNAKRSIHLILKTVFIY